MAQPVMNVELSQDWLDRRWVSVPERIARDRSLSWKAKGLVLALASHTETFKFSAEDLMRWASDGRDSTQSGLRELEKARYLVRLRLVTGHMVYRLFDEPQPENPVQAGQDPRRKTRGGKPEAENPSAYKKSTEGTPSQKEQTDQQILLDESSDGQASLLPELEPEPKSSPEPKADPLAGFSAFYALYPRHVGRKGAERSWLAAIRRGANPELIMEGCRRYAGERAGQDKTYTKYPSTWLNQDCWLDEPASRPVVSGGTTLNISNQDYWDGVAAEEAEAAANAEPTPTYF